MSGSKSLRDSRTLFSILPNLNALIRMVLILPLISNSSSILSKLLGTVPSEPTTIGITDTFMFNSFFFLFFFSSLTKSKYLSILLLSFIFTLWSTRMAKSSWWQVLFFLLITPWSGLLPWVRLSVCISKSRRILSFFLSRTDSGLCKYHLVAWSN